MLELWYESTADRKEHVLFVRRNIIEDKAPMEKGEHVHGAVEFAIGLSGVTNIFIKGEKYELTEGRIIFINRFVPHTYRYLKGSQAYVVLISPSFLDGRSGLNGITFPTVMEKCDGFNLLRDFLDASYAFRDINDFTYKSGFVGMFKSAMMSIYPYVVENDGTKAGENIIEIMRYINENYREELSIASVARRFGYSPNYLSSILNKHTGMSFRDHLNRCRISEYTNLRNASPEITVSQTAEAVGFRNMKTFYNALKKAKEEMDYRDCEF